MARHLQAHGAEADHAGASYRFMRLALSAPVLMSWISDRLPSCAIGGRCGLRMSARRRAVAASSSVHARRAARAPRRNRARPPPARHALAHVGEHALGIARERIAVAAAARRIEPEHVARLQRIVGVAGRQALGLRRVSGLIQMSPVRPVAAAGEAVRRDDVLHRADREARVGEIEVFAADAEPAAEFAGAAGIRDQLEAQRRGSGIRSR